MVTVKPVLGAKCIGERSNLDVNTPQPPQTSRAGVAIRANTGRVHRTVRGVRFLERATDRQVTVLGRKRRFARVDGVLAGLLLRTLGAVESRGKASPPEFIKQLLKRYIGRQAHCSIRVQEGQHAISPDRTARVVSFAIDAPEDTTISEFTVGPTSQSW